MKLLTVTVPCYNSAAYMRRSIESLLDGGERIEIIIIDDGSTDDTGKIADEYKTKYPQIVKVIHQQNGGHGEGINQGVTHAEGIYFKVVDSDDWVDKGALSTVLDGLERLEAQGGADMCVSNYVYEYEDGRKSKRIRYANIFPDSGQIVSWSQTKRFSLKQYLTLHSVIFRTEILKKQNYKLPKHISYEDNLFIYVPLPEIKRICYLDADLYRYLIGREGQSVSESQLIKKAGNQRIVTEKIFELYDVYKIKEENPKLGAFMLHELWLMMSLGTLFTRLGNSDECDKDMLEMWQRCEQLYPKTVRKLKYNKLLVFLCIPGRFGRNLSILFYRIAHKIVSFN